jgi:hypothetical protein
MGVPNGTVITPMNRLMTSNQATSAVLYIPVRFWQSRLECVARVNCGGVYYNVVVYSLQCNQRVQNQLRLCITALVWVFGHKRGDVLDWAVYNLKLLINKEPQRLDGSCLQDDGRKY